MQMRDVAVCLIVGVKHDRCDQVVHAFVRHDVEIGSFVVLIFFVWILIVALFVVGVQLVLVVSVPVWNGFLCEAFLVGLYQVLIRKRVAVWTKIDLSKLMRSLTVSSSLDSVS